MNSKNGSIDNMLGTWVISSPMIEYIRKGGKKKKAKDGRMVGGHKAGVFVAFKYGPDKCRVGFSMCNLKAGDKFDLDIGIRIAIGRAMCDDVVRIPKSISRDMLRFLGRVAKYYKGAHINQPVTVSEEVHRIDKHKILNLLKEMANEKDLTKIA